MTAGTGTTVSRGVEALLSEKTGNGNRWVVAYCRDADAFVLIVKGSKAQAEAIREKYRCGLESSLKLRLNMDKTRITHVNDGFIFLGHRIIRKCSRHGDMRVVMIILRDKKLRSFPDSFVIRQLQ